MNNLRKKVCFVTGTRAEYGLLKHLMREVSKSNSLSLQIIATGTHLSINHGYTIDEIIEDGFTIDSTIDIDIEDDSNNSTCLSLSKLIENISIVFDRLSPDLIVVLGDRYELLGIVSAATIHRIPVAHIHGGEITEGAFDEGIRHAITKLSHIHFVASDPYRKRVIQLGENPSNVFNVGGLGVDALSRLKVLQKKEIEKQLCLQFKNRNLLITYHPLTQATSEESQREITELIKALSKYKETLQIFTMPNSDPGNKYISEIINFYVSKNEFAFSFNSLGQKLYLSCLANVDAVIGNSSSGLLEAPSFKIGTINIGERQKGRLMAKSIINVPGDSKSISNAIYEIYTSRYQQTLKSTSNPYGKGGSSSKIVEILNTINLESITKKPFFDLKIDN
tara:strand:+ start:1 stop:1179 length:1179 start_codon:yes stop_codon:yes gene_type:complete